MEEVADKNAERQSEKFPDDENAVSYNKMHFSYFIFFVTLVLL